eukprot:COSAG06_NODE_310_length_17775_cov_9.971374_6_plen_88_part_00
MGTDHLPRQARDKRVRTWKAATAEINQTNVSFLLCRLNALEGLFVEATSATVLAAAKRLVGRGVVAAEERVLVVVTGSGFKEPMPRL